MTTAMTVPRAPLAGTVLDLLERSRASLLSACHADSVADRYVEAHLAALRAAAALLAARSRPSRRAQLRSVWEVLPQVAPELTEWAVFFAASAKRRAALARGAAGLVARESDDLLRQSEIFFELVQGALGLPMSRALPVFMAVTGRQDVTRQDATGQPRHDNPRHDDPRHDDPRHDDPRHDDPRHDDLRHDDA